MATVEERGDGRVVQLKGVRLSFCDSLKDKKKTSDSPEAKEKHSLNVILDATSPHHAANKAKVMSAIKAACAKQWKNEDAWKAIQEEAPKRICYRKGSRWKNREGKVYAGYEGEDTMAFSASGPSGGQKRPKLLDRQKREVKEDEILDVCYGGTYGDVIVSFFGTDKGSRGVFASVDAIRSHQTGDNLGGGGIPVDADDFDDLDDDDSFGSDSDDDLLGGF